MAISFNNIPDTIRTPGAFTEIDSSRALQGLAAVPHKVLLLGQKIDAATVEFDSVVQITSDGLADGFFGPGSVLARMCNTFKSNNPNTEMFAMALGSGIAGIAASATINFSAALDGATASGTETLFLMVNGTEKKIVLTSGDSGQAFASLVASTINADSTLGVRGANTLGTMFFSAVQSGTLGNYHNIRFNFFEGQSLPTTFSATPVIVSMAGGLVDPDLADAWAVIDNERYHYIGQPYIDATNLGEVEGELEDRFTALENKQGHMFTAVRATLASATTLGNSRNSPHGTIMAAFDSPTAPEEWAAALTAQASFNLNSDPARPLHTIELKDILPPPLENRFTRAERDILLFDGLATFTVESGKPLIERSITTYQTNALGIPDVAFLDVQTLATLGEIRDQYQARMLTRFILPRFKLADNTFPVQPGTNVATPNSVGQEIIALFTQLRDAGLIENLENFIENLIVERNAADRNRVDVLLPPDLINQFRVLASKIQFIL